MDDLPQRTDFIRGEWTAVGVSEKLRSAVTGHPHGYERINIISVNAAIA